MSTTHRVYNDRRWKAIRRMTIANASGKCQIRLPGCTSIATQADHVTALEDGGAPFAPGNVQASCRHCNVAKENNRRDVRRNPSAPTPSREW
jgi:5-methylcytosine-specific restriction endonuclease McrA